MAETNQMKARVDTKHPFLVMMGLYLGAFIGMFSETSLNIALPVLSQTFRLDTSVAQWLVTGYMLVIGLVLPFASILMKKFPVRKLTFFALGAFFVGSLISGFAPVFSVLLIGRLIQGIGTGLILPMMFAVVLEVFPANKIGTAMGVTALIIMFAPAIGPTLSGLVLGALSWRWLFFIFAIVLAVAIGFAAKYMVNPYELTKPKIDVLSVITSCLGFGGIVLGAGLASAYGWGSAQVIIALVVGVVALVIYCRRQLTMEHPVLNLRAFKIPAFTIGTLMMMINFGITLSAMYLLPQYLQNGAQYAVAMTGLIMLPGGVVNALVSLGAGRLYDKVGAKIPTKVGFALSIVGAILLLLTTKDSGIAYIILCHVILMIGVPLAMSPAQSSALNSLPPELSTDGSTILNTLQQVFGAISTAVTTSLLGAGQKHYLAAVGHDSAAAFTTGTHYGLYFTLALAIMGFLISFGVREKKNKKQ